MSNQQQSSRATIPTFTVELGDDKNRQINVPILHDTFRGKWSIHNLAGRDVGQTMAVVPDIPGIQLTINPRSRTVLIHDPLGDDKDRLRRTEEALRKANIVGSRARLEPMEDREVKLDEHEMKTLVRFVCEWLVSGGKAERVKGQLPSSEDIDALSGEYLFDPGSEIQHGRPKFEKDAEEYYNKLEARV